MIVKVQITYDNRIDGELLTQLRESLCEVGSKWHKRGFPYIWNEQGLYLKLMKSEKVEP